MSCFYNPVDRASQFQGRDPLNPGNRVHKVTATSLQELELAHRRSQRVQQDEQGFPVYRNRLLAAQTRYVFAPSGPSDYRTRSMPVLTVDAVVLPEAVTVMDLIHLPETYFRCAALFLKRDFFLQLLASSPRTPAPQPTTEEISSFYRSKLISVITDLLDSGDWIDDPSSRYVDPDHAEAVAQLNLKMSLHPLGRQSHMTFSSSSPRKRSFSRDNSNLESA